MTAEATSRTHISYEWCDSENRSCATGQSHPPKMIDTASPARKLTRAGSEHSSMGTVSTCPTSTDFSDLDDDNCLCTINTPLYHGPNRIHQQYHAQQQEGGADTRRPVNGCHHRERHQIKKKRLSSPASICTTDAIYHLYQSPRQEGESDSVSSIGSTSSSRCHVKEEQSQLQDDLVSLLSSYSLPQHAIITPRAKTNRCESVSSCTFTPPIVLKHHSTSPPLNLPWDEEVHTRLEEDEEQDVLPIFSLEEADPDEEDEMNQPSISSSPQSILSLKSSTPLERKCVLQNSGLTAMIAQTNAMLMIDEIQWIYQNKNAPQPSKCPIPPVFTSPKEDRKGTTSPYQDVPFDCDDDGESDEQEEDLHSLQRLDTLNQMERNTNKAEQRSRNMAVMVKRLERRALEARWGEEECHHSKKEVDSHGNREQRRSGRSDHLDNHPQHHNTRTRRTRKTRTGPTLSMPTQAHLFAFKIVSVLLLSFFNIVSLDIVLSIAMEKGRMLHSFFLALSHNHFLTIWDLVAVGMMFSVTTLDVAIISTFLVSKTASGSSYFGTRKRRRRRKVSTP